ncbi:RecB-like helicase [Helicobacter typhlonius]|uniref:RecB-like helicase n=1 Tax=Helicobacter typhlonius TaxID=76936 RepID=UPI002FDF9F02
MQHTQIKQDQTKLAQAQFLALKASAGSGKTFNLALRFIYLLFCGANPHQILTLTFTKKASNEMRHRIYEYLRSLKQSIADNTYQNNIIYQDLCEKRGLSYQFISQNINKIYAEFMQTNPRITTIDAFFHNVLKKFCWYVGVSAYFEIGNVDLGAINERFLGSFSTEDMDKIVRFCFFNRIKIMDFLRFLSSLCAFPARDIKHALGEDLESINLSYEDIDSAIKERMNRIYEHIDSIMSETKRAKTYFAQKITAQSIAQSSSYLLKWSTHNELKNYKLDTLDQTRNEILSLIKIYYVKKEQEVLSLIKNYIVRYDKSKQAQIRSQSFLDYNDVTLKNYELFMRNIDRDFFYFRLDDKITHILLDEFQDTSIMQFQILKPIIDEIKSGDSRKKIDEKSLFVVGDEKQSIYGFRGSFSAVFKEATKGLTQENLPYNFRSKPRVIEFNNRLFKECYKDYIPSKSPDENAQGGYVRVLKAVQDSESLGAQVYTELEALVQNGADENQIAILVFKNNDATLLKDYINEQNPRISIVTEASSSLFAKKEVVLILNALRYISLLKLQADSKNSNKDSKNTKTSADMCEISNALRLYEKQIGKLWGRAYIESAEVVAKISAIDIASSPANVVLSMIETFNIANSVSLRFLELASECKSINEVLDLESKAQCNAPAQSNKGVKIMTIHKSKGLEFEYLIVCDRIGGTKGDMDKFIYEYDKLNISRIYYKSKARESFDEEYNKALQEHKKRYEQEKYNVLYVAFTRARYGLSVIRKEKSSEFEILNLSEEIDALPRFEASFQQDLQMSKPINVLQSMQHFGRQNDFIRQERHSSVLESAKWHNIHFGEAIHSAFELYFSFGLDREDIGHILFNRYGFGLDREHIKEVINIVFACINNPRFAALMKNKKILCEVGYIVQSCLYRIDALLQDEKECFVLDYKSGTREQEAQEAQVRNYMRFLDSFYGESKKIRGFIIYPLKKQDEQILEVSLGEKV